MTDSGGAYDVGIDRFLKRFRDQHTSGDFSQREVLERLTNSKTAASDFPMHAEALLTPIRYECDVLVVGGGPAGLSASLAAARSGANTMLIERYGCFGGVVTTVGMETLGWYRYEGTSDSEGIGRELERVAEQLGGTRKWAFNDSPCLDAEHFKVIADRLIEESGVRPLLHTLVVDAIVKEGKIEGVVVENKTGRSVIKAKRVIDCSGDADVAHHAGCRYTKIPREEALGVTSVFNVSGVDVERFNEHIAANPATYADWSRTWNQETTGKEDHLLSPYWDKEFEDAVSSGVIEQPAEHASLGGSWSSLTSTGEATNLNLVHMNGFDATDTEDLTKAEMQGRKLTKDAILALRSQVPGFENIQLRNFSMTLGVRDTRKILSRHMLSGEDVCHQGRFADAVGVFPEFVDGYSILILPTTGRYFQIPYGCMVPEVDNLLVAGRCVGGDMIANAATRNMMCCTVTGQAAGVAAAVSIKHDQTTMSIDITLVQDELRRQGARID